MPISDVSTPCPAYLEMARHWDLIDDLIGGTLRMRDVARQGEKWLPRMVPHEELDRYWRRVEISVLYNALADTVAQLTAKPFSEPLNLGGELPDVMADLEENADRAGRSLHAVARASFEDACKYGLTHFQIDMPPRGESDPVPTREDQLTGRVRPSLIPRSAKDVIGWRSTTLPSGAHVLTQVRIQECVEVEDGPWGTKTVKQILVLNAPTDGGTGTWERYREPESGANDWSLVGNGTHSYPGVPLVTWYTRRTGFLTALPPLEDLAWLNLRHWQSSSDQARILQFARAAAMVFIAGVRPDSEGKPLVVEFMGIRQEANPDASATMIEHSGAAVKAGEDDLRKLEERMETLGQQPFLERSSDSTATGVRSQGSKTRTIIQSWIAEEEAALDRALAIAATFANTELPEELAVDIHSEFQDYGGDSASLQILLTAWREGLITDRTMLDELKRRRELSERVDVDEQIEEKERRGPPQGLFSSGPPNLPPTHQPPPGAGDAPKGGEPSAGGPAGSRQAA